MTWRSNRADSRRNQTGPPSRNKCEEICQETSKPFERLEVSKDDLRKMFGYSKYKMHYIEKFVPEASPPQSTAMALWSIYVKAHTSKIRARSKSFKIMKNSSAYFLGDQNNDSSPAYSRCCLPHRNSSSKSGRTFSWKQEA